MPKSVDEPMQMDDPPIDKMEDGVVVVVESGAIECEVEKDKASEVRIQDEGSQDDRYEQEERVVDENIELIKVALAAEHGGEQTIKAEKDNGAINSEGLQQSDILSSASVKSSQTVAQIPGDLSGEISKKNSSYYVENSSAYEAKVVEHGTETEEQREVAIDEAIADKDAIGALQDETDLTKFTETRQVRAENVTDATDKPGFDMDVLPTVDDLTKKEFEEDEIDSEADSNIAAMKLGNYACEECGKRFTHVSSKKRHMLKHKEGDSPIVYQCLACSKTFQYNSSLKRHLKLHSEETTGKAYTCTECTKAFMYATSLKRHLKTHSGKEIYPCSHCQRCFEYVSSLKRHEKLHTVGKGFRCEVCSKAFGYLSSLTRHQRVHQKSLTCEKCNKDFRLYKSYVKHLEEHGEILGEDVIAAMQVEDTGDEEEDVKQEFHSGDEVEIKCKTEHNDAESQIAENSVSAAMVVDNIPPSSENNQLDAIQGDIIDLQSAENHPFVKFVVSQNTVTLEHLQSLQASHAANSTEGTTNQDAVTYAVVQAADGSSVLGENCMAANSIQDLADNQVGGIVLVELDQNNKVTERHMEGLQAANLLQLLQAVEGFAVEANVQPEKGAEQLPGDGNEVALKTETEAENNQVKT